MVRAKVSCDRIEGQEVFFRTVYEPDAERDSENARFTQATPWGEMRMGINNPAALEQFAVGKYYYVDFHEAVPATPKTEPENVEDHLDDPGVAKTADAEGISMPPRCDCPALPGPHVHLGGGPELIDVE